MKIWAAIIRVLFLALFLFLVITGKMFLWLALFGVSLAAAIFFGRIYCGYICPMNTLMIPAQWLSKKLKFQTDKTPKWLENGVFAWIFFVVTVAVVVISQKVLHKNLPFLLIWLAISVLVTLRYKPEVFHNLLCPFGALQKLAGKFSFLSKRVHSDRCIGCKLCEKACPSKAIAVMLEDKKAKIDKKLCHQCENCTLICPKNAIDYGRTFKKKP
ncbi:MAG TPA: 4Fe-4S binding protein [Oscillospiraceae bacterium]|nr:4Fe-4S binding protein [Oscillospiraceae bacterium]HPS34084.1 4Fe-4S binding protein [Oscillospiraceae bacterium]